eukprot:802959-Rhodomonas_salina.1
MATKDARWMASKDARWMASKDARRSRAVTCGIQSPRALSQLPPGPSTPQAQPRKSRRLFCRKSHRNGRKSHRHAAASIMILGTTAVIAHMRARL